jgi:hypothetical protein
MSCPTPASNGGATCDATSGTCHIACNFGFKNCAGTKLCVPSAGCCVSADCTSGPANSVGVCGTANTCSYPCANGFTACGNACITKGACCTDGDCVGSTSACNGTCQANHACSFPTGSCGLATCSGPQVVNPGTCSAGTCNTPSPANCANNFVCSGASCKTSCSSSADCATNFACLGTACVAATVDQQQLMRSLLSGPLGGTITNEKLAQVVTAGTAGTLVEVRLAVACTVGSAMSVQIQGVTAAGAPDGNILSSVSIQPGMLPSDGSLRAISLTTPITLAIGTQFAIVAIGPATDSCAMTFGPIGNTYPGGQSFLDARPNPPGWVQNTGDLPFQTVVAP